LAALIPPSLAVARRGCPRQTAPRSDRIAKPPAPSSKGANRLRSNILSGSCRVLPRFDVALACSASPRVLQHYRHRVVKDAVNLMLSHQVDICLDESELIWIQLFSRLSAEADPSNHSTLSSGVV